MLRNFKENALVLKCVTQNFNSKKISPRCSYFYFKVPYTSIQHSYGTSTTSDYQYLQRSTVPTMHFQPSLPRLPIPELEKTCERYLNAVKPMTLDEKFQKTQNIVNHFKSGEGKSLDEELRDNNKKNKHTSYISGTVGPSLTHLDHTKYFQLWLGRGNYFSVDMKRPWFDMYLKSRVPVVLNFNPFMSFKDDPDKNYNTQLIRATNMLVSSLRFMKSLRGEILEPEVFHLNPSKSDTAFFRKTVRLLPKSVSWYGAYLFKAFPLDMSQFRHLFNATRVPRIGKDELQVFPEAKHIVVLRNGYFYVFDVLDGDGNILPPSHIFSYLSHIIGDNKPPPSHPLSALTTENRDTWAEVREHLKQLGNRDQLQLIDSALFTLALDDEVLGDDQIKSAHHMLHGPAHNRWFDKSFQLIITKDGKACVNFEHSWGDGVAVLRYFNEVFSDSVKNHFVGPETHSANVDTSHRVHRLDFNLDESIKSAIKKALQNYSQVTSSLQLDVLQYRRLNRDSIKNFKLSPDSVAQLGFQMAFYKLYGKFVATYESCSTSAFKHGRTETVRPVTMATKDCVESFHEHNKPNTSKLKAKLQECTKVHNQLTKEAAMGQGFDRHLFCLKYLAESSGRKVPSLYEDEVYQNAMHFTLSTSTLFGPAFSGGGFGPVVQDGFGVAYGFMDDFMGCLVSSYASYQNGKAFVDALGQSFDEIHQVLEATK